MARIPVALFNVRGGCLRPDGIGFDFSRLHHAAVPLTEAPALWLINEAKLWHHHHGAGLHAAAAALGAALNVPYVGQLGTLDRGPLPPAIIYDPTRLVLLSWPTPTDTYYDQQNLARFAIRDPTESVTDDQFLTWVDHLHPNDPSIRLQEAKRRTRFGRQCRTPVIGGGDINCNGSGEHLRHRDWPNTDYERRAAEGRQLFDGRWTTNSDPVDHLIGICDNTDGRRVGGCGYQSIAEIAWHAGHDDALEPTVQDKPGEGGPIIKDWLFVNPAMACHIDPDGYRVHPPHGPDPSDHHVVTATFDLSRRYSPTRRTPG
jgi:hypothetical protein